MGAVELLLIYQVGDLWEPEWRPLQGSSVAALLPILTDETMNHAIRGWTKPFVTALGLPPAGSLRKLPKTAQQCEHRDNCPFYQAAQCVPVAKRLPNCFQPSNLDGAEARSLAYEAIRLWREGVYIAVVKESADAHRHYPRADRNR
jgi:hypothetical protein